jgi:two-component system, cell cycle sensor histidine kinase and response regulator CckA
VTPAHGAETILVVDDEQSLGALIKRMLAKQGYTVLNANSGEEALRLIESQSCAPDLLLTDMVLGGSLNGLELADRVCALSPQVRVLFMSGYASDVISVPDLVQQGRAFLAKPFTTDTLGRTVREVLDAK